MYQGTDQVFDGHPLNELIDSLRRARPGAVAMSQAASAYERFSSTLGEAAATVRSAMDDARAAHQGAAAEASLEYTTRLARQAADVTGEAGAASGSVTTQSQHHADTMARMPQPAEQPSVWSALAIPLDPSHSFVTQAHDYAERSHQAVNAMNTYQTSSNTTVAEFAGFAEPTMTPVGLGERNGAANPAFPSGGGAGSAPGAPTGQGTGGGIGGGHGVTPPATWIPVVPQRARPPANTGDVGGRDSTSSRAGPRRSGSAIPGATLRTGGPTPELTPLRPRPAVPGAWDGAGGAPAGQSRGPLAPGAQGAVNPARAGTGGSPYMPVGAGAGGRRGEQEHRRPSWLLEDDPQAAFGPMPPHAPAVIEATDPNDPR